MKIKNIIAILILILVLVIIFISGYIFILKIGQAFLEILFRLMILGMN